MTRVGFIETSLSALTSRWLIAGLDRASLWLRLAGGKTLGSPVEHNLRRADILTPNLAAGHTHLGCVFVSLILTVLESPLANCAPHRCRYW
jgi:hypothetical protein